MSITGPDRASTVAQLQDAVRSLESASVRPQPLHHRNHGSDLGFVLELSEGETDFRSGPTSSLHEAQQSLLLAIRGLSPEEPQTAALTELRTRTIALRDGSMSDNEFFAATRSLYQAGDEVLRGLSLTWNVPLEAQVLPRDVADDLRSAGLGWRGATKRYGIGLLALGVCVFGLLGVFLLSAWIRTL